MNEVIKLLIELQERANQGYDIEDAKLDIAMQTLQNAHNTKVDSNILLTCPQKRRRKELYEDCVKTAKKYIKQCLQDDKEIKNYLSKQK